MHRRLLVGPLAAPAAEAKPGPKLTVMTRKIYLGGNIALPIGATSHEDFEQRATQLWQQVQATNFPARAEEWLPAGSVDSAGCGHLSLTISLN